MRIKNSTCSEILYVLPRFRNGIREMTYSMTSPSHQILGQLKLCSSRNQNSPVFPWRFCWCSRDICLHLTMFSGLFQLEYTWSWGQMNLWPSHFSYCCWIFHSILWYIFRILWQDVWYYAPHERMHNLPRSLLHITLSETRELSNGNGSGSEITESLIDPYQNWNLLSNLFSTCLIHLNLS